MPSERLVLFEGRDVKDLPGLHKSLETQGFKVISCDQIEDKEGAGPCLIIQLDAAEARDPRPIVEGFQDTAPSVQTWVTLVSSNGARWRLTVGNDGTLSVLSEE